MKDVKFIAGYVGWVFGASLGIALVSVACQKVVGAVLK
jgi:hypothetical protein